MGGIIAMVYAADHGERLDGLVLNDIGPDAEPGTQRITQTVTGRPDSFATLDEAMAYRRDISPITANRPLDDQRELALGVLRQGRTGAGSGRWTPPTSPAASPASPKTHRCARPPGPPSPRCNARPW